MRDIGVAQRISFAIDIPKCNIGDHVTIVGVVEKRKGFAKGVEGVWLRDITGQVLAIINSEEDPIAANWIPQAVFVNTRIKISGEVSENEKRIRVLRNIDGIEVLVSANTTLPDLAEEMREHASSMLMSRITQRVADTLRVHNFTQFVSRAISQSWQDVGLEPMQVLYPGFGSPAYLIPSPSAQVLEFLTTSLLRRAFTTSTSFTQTYRFTQSASETQVVVAKATDLPKEDHAQLFRKLSDDILEMFFLKGRSFSMVQGVWPNMIDGVERNETILTDDLNLVEFAASIPVIGERWDTQIDSILQLFDRDMNILAEGTTERLSEKVSISSLTIYPSQYLGVIEKSPRRQLRNLMGLYYGKRK